MKRRYISMLAGVAMVCLASSAQAAIIYSLQSVVPVGPNFAWTYNAVLQGDQKIQLFDVNSPERNFGVMYDFGGFIPGSLLSVDLTGGLITVASFEEFLTVPQPFAQAVPDLPGLWNLRTEITAGAFNAGADTPIYRITALSAFGVPTMAGNLQSAQTIKDDPGNPSDNTLAGNTVNVEGPGTITTPEPASLLLLGAGLLGLAARRRKAR